MTLSTIRAVGTSRRMPARWRHVWLRSVMVPALAWVALSTAGLPVPRVQAQQPPPVSAPMPEAEPTAKEPGAGKLPKVPAIQTVAFYVGSQGKPIEDKVTVGGKEVLDRAELTNKDYGLEIRPVNAPADHPLLPKVRALLKALPPRVHELAGRYVMAVYLLEEDFGTGTTEGVQDEQGHWRYSYITLNLTALTRTANAWAGWKETSTFHQAQGFSLAMQVEPAADDTIENAVQFILLHELGHALGLGLGAHGFWEEDPVSAATRDSPFVNLSWQADQGGMASRYAWRYPRLSKAAFYRFDKANLQLSEAEAIYRALTRTNYPSLYAVTNLYDDFAETFVIYVHTQLLGRPYSVEVSEGGQPRFQYRSCIQTGTCPEKVKALEKLLGK